MNVKELLRDWLDSERYDGLCTPEMECGCMLDDLIPCGSDPSSCIPGHRMNGDQEHLKTCEMHGDGLECKCIGVSK